MSDARDYYVSMIRDKRYKLLAGPFATHLDALQMVDPAKREAARLDPFVDFDAFGTCSMPRNSTNKDGWLNIYLGVKPREMA
jgi:hypothetical protein